MLLSQLKVTRWPPGPLVQTAKNSDAEKKDAIMVSLLHIKTFYHPTRESGWLLHAGGGEKANGRRRWFTFFLCLLELF